MEGLTNKICLIQEPLFLTCFGENLFTLKLERRKCNIWVFRVLFMFQSFQFAFLISLLTMLCRIIFHGFCSCNDLILWKSHNSEFAGSSQLFFSKENANIDNINFIFCSFITLKHFLRWNAFLYNCWNNFSTTSIRPCFRPEIAENDPAWKGRTNKTSTQQEERLLHFGPVIFPKECVAQTYLQGYMIPGWIFSWSEILLKSNSTELVWGFYGWMLGWVRDESEV